MPPYAVTNERPGLAQQTESLRRQPRQYDSSVICINSADDQAPFLEPPDPVGDIAGRQPQHQGQLTHPGLAPGGPQEFP